MSALPDDLQALVRDDGREVAVLVVRLGAMGDVLRTLPAVRRLRAALRDARLAWVLDRPWAVLLRGQGAVDEVVALPRRNLLEAGRWLGALRALRSFGPDLAIDFHGNLRSGVVGLLSGARARLGYDGHQQKEGNRWLLTHRLPSGERRLSRVARNLGLLAPLGIEPGAPEGTTLAIDGAARERVRARLGPHRYLAINPGASAAQAYKKPPVGVVAAAAREASRRGLRPLVLWGPGERDDARAVVEAAGGAAELAPGTTLPELAALLADAVALVSGDSGPLHLACAAGCPVVGIYGPTDPEVNAPWSVPHEVVAPAARRYTGIKRIDRAAGGFEGVEPDAATAAVARLLERVARGAS